MFDRKQIKLITLDFDGTTLQKDQTWMSFRTMRSSNSVMSVC